MKQGKLIRRAVSAALAGCMMFTFSAPALAESTDALMQLSISGNRAASVLDAENGAEEIKINNEVINPADYDNIVINNKYTFRYDPVQKVLTSTSTIPINAITIKVPDDVDVVLDGKEHIAVNNLTINGAHDVMISSDNDPAIGSKAKITCTGKVTIDAPGANFAIGATNSSTSDGLLTISGASEVEINAPNSSRILGGFYSKADITCDGPVTIRGNVDGGSTLAKSFTYNRTDGAGYVYFTSEDEEEGAIDASVTPLVQDGKYTYLRIEEKQDAHLKVHNGTVTVGDTTSKELDSFKGQKVTVASTIEETEDRKFDGWEVTKAPAGFTISADKLKQKKFSFIMPTGNVELTAHHSNKLEVSGGTAAVNGNAVDFARPKADVRVTATDLSAKGYQFDHWVVSSGDIGKTGDELKANPLDFTMPDAPVTAVAKYKKLLGITVNSGKAYVEDTETDAALKGKLVVIKADEIEGKRFDHWEIVSKNVILNDLNAPETMFTMPETAVEITAVYNDLNAITVHNGTADVEKAVIGETVKIKADSREGYVFDRWEVNYGDVVVDDKNAEETTFTMPDSMVVLTARYKALQSITLENGKAYAGGEEITTAKKGTEVTIKAENLDGKVFDHWEIVSGNVTLEDAYKAETTFTMPAESISLEAVYNTIHSIRATFCTADPASAIVGTEITVTAESREGYVFDHWEASDGVELTEDGLTAKFTMPDHDVTIEAKYKQYHSIEVSKGTAYDADGKEITSAVVGDKITIVANDRDSHEFNRWEIDPDNVILEDPNADETAFIMPDEPVSVEAKYKHLQSITMNHGTAYDEDFSETDIAKAKQTITIKAEDRYADGLVFDHWAVDTDNVTLADEYGEKTTFEMVNGAVELTAHYKARVTVFSVPAKFEEGIGEHSDETWEKVGETATITAEIDEETFPGMEFDYWEVIPTDLDIGDIHSPTISFEVPECEVKLVAHWKASGMKPIVDPDEDLDPGFGVETESSDGGAGGAGAAIAGVAIGGAAVWGGYEIATRIILNDLLPAGAAIPANRGQLALLIWTEKGKPEPAAQPAFVDITDAELAKAAQWCVEQGLLDAREGKFESDGWMPKFKTIEIWNKAFPKK